MSQRTLYDKIWDDHFVAQREDGSTLMYIDRHLIHEVTSPQAFDGLRQNSLIPRQVGTVVATPDHNVPTTDRSKDIEGIKDPISKLQVVTLNDNCDEFGINQFKLNDERQGIVHVIGPEQGITLPGMTIVCGDSHTSTHGAFGSLAMGIGTSEVEHVLATQCLVTQKQKNMLIEINGQLQKGVTAKDVTMFIIGKIGTAGGTEHVIEYAGSAIENLTMEGRMTLCNMAIEAGARAGMVAPDEKTFDYVANRPFSPKGSDFDKAVKYWASLKTDPDASFNATYSFEASEILPQVTWGTSPEMVANIEAFEEFFRTFFQQQLIAKLSQFSIVNLMQESIQTAAKTQEAVNEELIQFGIKLKKVNFASVDTTPEYRDRLFWMRSGVDASKLATYSGMKDVAANLPAGGAGGGALGMTAFLMPEMMRQAENAQPAAQSAGKTVEEVVMVDCNQCDAKFSPAAKFCSSCGDPTDDELKGTTKFCTNCGAKLDPSAKFCVMCGTKL